jgi:hypothetical protein
MSQGDFMQLFAIAFVAATVLALCGTVLLVCILRRPKRQSPRGFEVKLDAGNLPAVTKERDDAHG